MSQAGTDSLATLIATFPDLAGCLAEIASVRDALVASFVAGHKLLLCGNGGSGPDCDHIAAELPKGFERARPLPGDLQARLRQRCICRHGLRAVGECSGDPERGAAGRQHLGQSAGKPISLWLFQKSAKRTVLTAPPRTRSGPAAARLDDPFRCRRCRLIASRTQRLDPRRRWGLCLQQRQVGPGRCRHQSCLLGGLRLIGPQKRTSTNGEHYAQRYRQRQDQSSHVDHLLVIPNRSDEELWSLFPAVCRNARTSWLSDDNV